MATSDSRGPIGRRSFLRLGVGLAATAGPAACASGADPAGRPIWPGSPRVAEVERTRRLAGARSTSVTLNAVSARVDLGGVEVQTWAYGGQLPGREIRVRRGEILKAELKNQLTEPTSVHWHGIALRNDMDGVPGLTQGDIGVGTSFTYEFAVPDAGTYFFHPHSGVQLDRGLYAPLIVEDPDDGADYDTELVIVLDDWLDGVDRTPDAALEDLRKNGMGGMDHGSMPGMTMPKSELLGGDAGDVTYPHVLANGRTFRDPEAVEAKAGQRVRLRLINAAADTAFRIGVPGARLRGTHTDGFPVQAHVPGASGRAAQGHRAGVAGTFHRGGLQGRQPRSVADPLPQRLSR